jgi:DNA (cytosine-5)-methyltransferase 1
VTAYYNEIEPFAAQWLRNLISRELIAPGEVDERSIRDVRSSDLAGFTQCHFFAGIGIWSHALRGAGWADDREVWTGSCPCQPFSVAGAGRGTDDERHLWPEFYRLISECHPASVFGEQVSGSAGRAWLDLVSNDLEGSGYAVAAADLSSAGVGAPNIRQRLYWLGNASSAGLSDAKPPHITGEGRRVEGRAVEQPDGPSNPWRVLEWIDCLDGKARPTQPGLFPLASRHPGDVGRLRAYGNAINAQVARTFIEAAMDCVP